MLHKFHIRGGQVTYMSRFLRSDAYQKNSERDRIVMSEFGTLAMPDPCKNFFQRFLSRFEMMRKSTCGEHSQIMLLHFCASQNIEFCLRLVSCTRVSWSCSL